MFKWLAGIVASIIAGVGIWFLTRTIFPEEYVPNIGAERIEARASSRSSDGSFVLIGKLSVQNNGTRAAESCRLEFEDTNTGLFTLSPGKSRTETLRGKTQYSQNYGILAVQGQLTCGDFSRILTGDRVRVSDSQSSSSAGNQPAISGNSTATGD